MTWTVASTGTWPSSNSAVLDWVEDHITTYLPTKGWTVTAVTDASYPSAAAIYLMEFTPSYIAGGTNFSKKMVYMENGSSVEIAQYGGSPTNGVGSIYSSISSSSEWRSTIFYGKTYKYLESDQNNSFVLFLDGRVIAANFDWIHTEDATSNSLDARWFSPCPSGEYGVHTWGKDTISTSTGIDNEQYAGWAMGFYSFWGIEDMVTTNFYYISNSSGVIATAINTQNDCALRKRATSLGYTNSFSDTTLMGDVYTNMGTYLFNGTYWLDLKTTENFALLLNTGANDYGNMYP